MPRPETRQWDLGVGPGYLNLGIPPGGVARAGLRQELDEPSGQSAAVDVALLGILRTNGFPRLFRDDSVLAPRWTVRQMLASLDTVALSTVTVVSTPR
jgi:hypothetical protein